MATVTTNRPQVDPPPVTFTIEVSEDEAVRLCAVLTATFGNVGLSMLKRELQRAYKNGTGSAVIANPTYATVLAAITEKFRRRFEHVTTPKFVTKKKISTPAIDRRVHRAYNPY